MPIYMDRHDIPPGIRAEHVAEMHQQDLKVQHIYGCKGMTYWCDEDTKTAFCLIEAPNVKALQDMHDHAHGDIPHSIVEVNENIVESFLGRIKDPQKASNTDSNVIDESALRIIMIFKIRIDSYKEFLENHSSINHFELMTECSEIIGEFDGNVVKSKNNCFLISFESVSSAVLCSLEIQTRINKIFKKQNSFKIEIALSAGLPVTENKEFFEEAIKAAERLCDIIPGKIIISNRVREIYKNENYNRFVNSDWIKVLNKTNENFLNSLMDYTDSVWNETDMNVGKFSKQLGYSKSQFYRKMIETTGKSPNNFLKEYRLRKARNLLDKKNNNISEVAFGTGFNSPAYFSKCFSQVYGILPSEYARHNSNSESVVS